MYELFSIMVLSGSAVGGHYYAYIKYVVTCVRVCACVCVCVCFSMWVTAFGFSIGH